MTLTDLPRILPLLQEGISLNKENLKNIQAKALTWGCQTDLDGIEPDPDLILLSDCIYYEASIEPLLKTLLSLVKRNPKVQILLSYETRDYLESKKKIAQEFFRTVGQHFKIFPFASEACHQDYASDDIRVIKLLPK